MAITITALGDSTTWGYNSGNQVQKNMVTTAQEELSKALKSPVDIINRGQNATTLGDAISNGNLYAAASDPSNVVILNYGMNEAYRRVNPEQFRQNLLDAAGYLQSLGKTVVLQTPNFTANPDIPNVDVYANVIRDVAGQYGLAVDDKYSATQSAEFSQNDLTHPTAEVYQQLGRSLATTLQPLVVQQVQQTPSQPRQQEPIEVMPEARPQILRGQAGENYGLLSSTPLNVQETAEARELGSLSGAYAGTQPGLLTTSNLNPADIAYLAQGKGMFGNELLGYDPTSPITWALQSGIAIPATSYLTQTVGNALGLTDASIAANTAVDQAAQGLSEAQITQNLVDLGLSRSNAIQVATDAVSGSTPFQIAQDISGATLNPAAQTTKAVTTTTPSGVTTSVPITSANLPITTGTAGLLAAAPAVMAPVVSGVGTVGTNAPQVQVTASNVPQAATPVEVAPSLLSVAPTQTATVTGKTMPTQQTGAGTAATQAAVSVAGVPESVIVEDRIIKREVPQVYVSTPAGTVTTPRGDIPVSEVKLPPGQPSTETPSMLPLLGLLGLGAAGAGLLNQENAVPFDQAAYDAIAKGRSPVYPRGEFTPISLGGLPGIGGISDGTLGAYDYFGPYYGAGRFGARPQAFALPGLLGPQMMSIPTTPSRSAAV